MSLSDFVEFRPCHLNDADTAVELIYAAGPQAFNYVFAHRDPGQVQSFLHRSYRHRHNEFSFRIHHGLYLDDRLIALGSMRYAHENLRFTLGAVACIARSYGLAAGAVIRRGLHTEAVITPPTGRVATLCNLAVLPAYRGQGLGQRLITELMALATAQGYDDIQLDVAETNPDAKRLYQRLGFRTLTRRENPRLVTPFGRVVAHERMQWTGDDY